MRHFLFLLVGEGKSDSALVPALERLCLLCGAQEVTGIAPDLTRLPNPVGNSIVDKIAAAIEIEPNASLIFAHRDADSADARPRISEVKRALEAAGGQLAGVPVVPIQETEAWLLLDEAAIRRAAGNPHGSVDLELPPIARIETTPNPKRVLEQALLSASELTGRRRQRLQRELGKRRRRLLEQLDPAGPVNQLSAWQRLRRDLERVLASDDWLSA